MSVTELIRKLEEIESIYGDLDCVHRDGVFERPAYPKVCKSEDFPDKKVVSI